MTRKLLLSKDSISKLYFFHLHTSYTDGLLSVKEYFQLARKFNVSQVIFLEHIRKSPGYDVDHFIDEIQRESEIAGIQASVGFETKILLNGTLDIDTSALLKADVIGIAEHGFPNDAKLFKRAWGTVINFVSDMLTERHAVWVHPGLFFKKQNTYKQYESELEEMIQIALSKGIILEHNLRYNLIPKKMIPHIPPGQLIYGIDSHNTHDIVRGYQKLKKCFRFSNSNISIPFNHTRRG